MSDVSLHVESVTGVKLGISESSTVPLGIGGDMYAIGTPYFDGDYTVTPTNTTQVLSMEGLRARQNVTVNPIPSNYGLITYNGSTITVS